MVQHFFIARDQDIRRNTFVALANFSEPGAVLQNSEEICKTPAKTLPLLGRALTICLSEITLTTDNYDNADNIHNFFPKK